MREPFTKEQLEELWRRLFPGSFTIPIETEAGGQGFDVYAQQAAQFERAQESIAVTQQAYYLRPHSTQIRPEAMGARAAVGELVFTRVAPAAGAVTIPAGTLFVAIAQNSRGVEVEVGEFLLLEAVTFPAGGLGPIRGDIVCTRVGYQGNLPPESVTRFKSVGTALVSPANVIAANTIQDTGIPDRFLRTMVGRYLRLTSGTNASAVPKRILSVSEVTLNSVVVDGPSMVFPSASVAEVLEFSDLGISIAQPAPTFGGRHGWLDAIGEDRNTRRQAGETDEAYRLRLTYLDDVVSPAAINRICARILTPYGINWRILETRDPNGLIGFTWDLHPYDWGTVANGIVWAPDTRFFVVLVGASGAGEFGFPYDQPFRNNAWDLLPYDGYPAGYYGVIASLYQAIDQAREAGVGFTIVRDFSL